MPASGPKLAVRTGDSGGSGQGARNRGTPGYPVPPEMQDREIETEPADVDQDDIKDESLTIEDIIVKMVVPVEIQKEIPTVGIVDPQDPLDLVAKAVVHDLIDDKPVVVGNTEIKEDGSSPVSSAPAGASTPRRSKDPVVAKTVLNAAHEKLLKHGVDAKNTKLLGRGSRGTAFQLKDGRTIKVTDDRREAAAMFKVKGKNLKHIVHVDEVWKFGDYYLILQETLTPIPESAEKVFNQATDGTHVRTIMANVSPDWQDLLKRMREVHNILQQRREKNGVGPGSLELADERFEQHLKVLEKFQFPGIVDDLHAMGIRFHDFHAGNIMKRGGDFVMIDLGYSDVQGAKEPPVLERAVTEALLRLLGEAKADQVGVTIGRYQPFHRGHAAMVRELANKFTRVILIVGGLKKDERNPFSFKVRERMIRQSIPDVISKVEIHEAKYQGKNSGFVPGILSQIIDKNDSTLKPETAVQVMVGNDRAQDMKGQLARAQAMRERGDNLSFDPTVAEVTTIPDVDEDGGRVSGTACRQAIESGDLESFKKMVDPHLLSNPEELDSIWEELRKELGHEEPKDAVHESIDAAGGQRSIEDTLDQNQDKLNAHRPFPIAWPKVKELGHGKDGFAYDMGGNKVFKVTTDPGEARTSHSLLGMNLQNVVRIFDVFKFPPSQGTQGSRVPLYGIVTEKLAPLSSQEKQELGDAIGWIMDPMVKNTVRARFVAGDWPGAVAAMEQAATKLFQTGRIAEIKESAPTAADRPLARSNAFQNQVSTPTDTSKTDPNQQPVPNKPGQKMNLAQAQSAAKKKIATIKATLEKYNLPAMAKELSSKAIKFYDYHTGNIMKRGGTYVINDLGRSDSRGSEPPILEQLMSQIVEDFAGPGNFNVGVKAGKTAFSSFHDFPDPDKEDLWQNQLKNLNVQIGHTAMPEEAEPAEEDECDPGT